MEQIKPQINADRGYSKKKVIHKNLYNKIVRTKQQNTDQENKSHKLKVRLRKNNIGCQITEGEEQIEREIDYALTEAYWQLDEQPERNTILGQQNILTMIPNELLKRYINTLYKKYDIEKPFDKIKRLKKEMQSAQKYSEDLESSKKTVVKSRISNSSQNQPETLQKIYRLKSNIRTQLSQHDQSPLSQEKRVSQFTDYADNSVGVVSKYPIATAMRRYKLKLKSKNENCVEVDEKLFFCFLCKKRIKCRQRDFLNSVLSRHAKECQNALCIFLEKFESEFPRVSILRKMVSQTIGKTQNELKEAGKYLKEEVLILQNIINTLTNQNMTEKDRTLKKPVLRQSNIKQCWQKTQFLSWIKPIYQKLQNADEAVNLTAMNQLGLFYTIQ